MNHYAGRLAQRPWASDAHQRELRGRVLCGLPTKGRLTDCERRRAERAVQDEEQGRLFASDNTNTEGR